MIEYLVIARFPDLLHAEQRLNTLAREGWRVVAVQRPGSFHDDLQILLGREKPGDWDKS